MFQRFFALIAILLITFSGLFAQPRIKIIPGTTLDLGDLYKGQKGERVVTIKNVGNDTLRITQVKASCGCTAALLKEKKESLAPSDTVDLSITFDTQNQPGKVTKQIYITSNDTTEPKVTIQFSANVLEVLKLNPPYFSFDNTKVDSTYVKTITITNPSKEKGIKILTVETKFENLKVTLMKNTLMPGEETQLQAVFHANKSGTAQGMIELTTDNPMQTKFDIKVYSWVNRK
jgi:hypothetical protein